LLSIFLVFSYFINESSTPVFKQVHAVGREKPPVQQTPVYQPPAESNEPSLYERVSGFLEPEVQQGKVEVVENYTEVIVRLRNKGLFSSGKARVNDELKPLLKRIADALNAVGGPVLVAGHSDNIPIHTLQFPSNWHLSMARAEAVSQLLLQDTDGYLEITAEGRADNEPLVPNDTPSNRAINRRVEIILEK
jgi:type VI secretion system protein ImpK